MSDFIYLTREGYNQYLEDIKQAERSLNEIRRFKGEVAIHQGDAWHDNPTFEDSEMQERIAMSKLFDLKANLEKIVIIEADNNSDTVCINSTVTFEMDEDGDKEICRLKLIATTLRDFETEVSINSPLGKAIFSKKVDDVVTYEVNGHKLKVKIIKIE